MSEIRAFRVDPQNVNMKKKELIDATITRIGKCGNILERRRIERGEKAEEFVADDYAASSGGYALIERDISESKYLEYDDKVVN